MLGTYKLNYMPSLKSFKFLFSISQMLEQQQRNQSKHPLQVRSKIMLSNSKVQIFVRNNFNQPVPPTQTKIFAILKNRIFYG